MMLLIAPIKRHSTSNEVCKVSRVQAGVLYAIKQLINLDRELEQDLVPEWRAKYFDYKVRLSIKTIRPWDRADDGLINRLARRRSRLSRGH